MVNQVVKNIFSIHDSSITKRDHLIDYLRGCAMMLVVLHHSSFPLGSVILAFHMPLFFILSGYLEFIRGGTKKPIKLYIKNKFMRLMVPYFTFEILNLIIYCIGCAIKHRALPGIESIISIVTCINNEYMGMYGRLWFLPCMFVADIYLWVLLRFLRNNKFAQIISVLVLFALSFITDKLISFRLPFTTDTALFAVAFIMLGYLFGDSIRVLIDKGNDGCKIVLSFLLLLYLVYAVYFTNVKVYMCINSYGEYTVSICAAIAGSIAFFILGSYLYRVAERYPARFRLLNGIILWYGKNSLVSFPIHLTIKMFILWYVPNLSRWYLLFVVMVFANIPIVNMITHYFPFMLGKKRVGKLSQPTRCR